jgi:uncharacterized membrane protein YhhN
MTTAALALFVVAGGFALGDWVSRVRDLRTLEYLCKPATLAALIGAAVTLDATSDSVRLWFVVALVCSLAGDVLLMLPSDRFVAGLGAFLVGHLAYVGGFVAAGIDAPAALLGGVGVAAVFGPIGTRIVGGARRADAAAAPPVAIYIVVISLMITASIGSGSALAALGAVTFAASDAMIGWTRFVAPIRNASVLIMITYHVAQALLVLSLL